MNNKAAKRNRLHKRIRTKISGTAKRPRLSVFRSNKFVYAQVIDDTAHKTIAAASDVKIEKGTKSERAKEVGKMVAAACAKAGIKEVVFDRGGFKYTGRLKLVADTARENGLKF
jgi:large subunit ribosomal protein L18